MRFRALILMAGLIVTVGSIGCKANQTTDKNGGSSSTPANQGGTETGSTTPSEVDTSKVASRMASAASALLPSFGSPSAASALALASDDTLTLGSDHDWATYLGTQNAYVITDIFGSPNEGFRVVTKIRVLLDQFKSSLDDILSADSKIACKGTTPLTAGETIEIPFYGTISNGPSGNRFFDCLLDGEVDHGGHEGTSHTHDNDHNETKSLVTASLVHKRLYGTDADHVIRFVDLSDDISQNTEHPETRGDAVRIRAVKYATYSEVTENGATVIYLDLQFSHGSSYNGIDGVFGTNDDVIFKSRSRITGRVVLDSSGQPSLGSGEFVVTKFDQSPDQNGNRFTTVTKTLGRGNYGSDQYALFRINTTISPLLDIPRTFCLQAPAGSSGLPSNALESHCSDFETNYAWGNVSFPFTVDGGSDPVFDKRKFFEGNDTDLVSNSGDNFSIPSY